jgi:hypothetical protein
MATAVGTNQYGDQLYQTPNGIKTGTQITQELASAGWGGGGDPVSVYNQTAGAALQPAPTQTISPVTTTNYPTSQDVGNQITQALSPLMTQSAGFSREQLAETQREFDAQLAWAREQFEKLGLPQLEIQKRLANMQQLQMQQAMGLAMQNQRMQEAQLTGYYNPWQLGVSYTGNVALDAFTNKASPHDQQTYLNANNGDQNAAAQQYWLDVQGAVQQAGMTPQQFAYGQASGTGQGIQTEAAKEFAQNLAEQQRQYNAGLTEQQRQYNAGLGMNYLTQAAQFAATDPFALSDYLRGVQAGGQTPAFLSALQQGISPGGASGNVGPNATGATYYPDLLKSLAGGGTPYGQANSALTSIGDIYTKGANALATGSLESLTPNELQALQQGMNRLYGSAAAPAFLQQYAASRPKQTAAQTSYFARGGIVTQPTLAVIGEAGPEAVVPLGQGLNPQNWPSVTQWDMPAPPQMPTPLNPDQFGAIARLNQSQRAQLQVLPSGFIRAQPWGTASPNTTYQNTPPPTLSQPELESIADTLHLTGPDREIFIWGNLNPQYQFRNRI